MTSGDGKLAQPESTANAAASMRAEIEVFIFIGMAEKLVRDIGNWRIESPTRSDLTEEKVKLIQVMSLLQFGMLLY
ncbi:MAG: hypothetical protein ABJA77_19490 [Variovorax sp.]